MNKIFQALLLLLVTSATAQKVTVTGMVTDSLNNPLDVANVVAVNQENQALDGFGITNDKGQYKLNLKANSDYILKVSYLGFSPAEVPLKTEETDVVLDVVLYEQAESLDEVEVVYEIPITIQGDTIVYNTDSFVSGTERKLADVLEKLPGIEVSDEGEIQVEGKTVTKVMVEGEEFFDGDSKLASKNIPANALSKVEVLRNYSEVSQLGGVTNNEDNVALNIKLKEGKKKFWFGEITGGLGLDERYIAHPKLFYYSPDFSVNILTDLNNIGEVAFSSRDYWNFTGGFRSATRSIVGTSFTTSSSSQGITTAQNNRAKSVATKFGAVNFTYKPTEAWRLSGYGIYSYNNTLMQTTASKTFISSGETEFSETNTDQTSKLGLLKLESSYKPNERLQWDYQIQTRLSDEDQYANTLSVSDITDEIGQNNAQKPTAVTQNTNLYYTLNPNHIFAFEGQYEYADEDPFYNAVRSEQPFEGLIPLDSDQSDYDINQRQYTQTNRLDAKLDYFWVTGAKSNINFTLGTTQSSQRFNSSIFQVLDSGNDLTFNEEELNNDVQFNFSDMYFGFHYKWILGKFTFNPGFHVHNYVATNSQLNTETKDELTNLVPDLFINFQLKQSESIRFNYNITRNFTDINNLAEGYIFNNYNSLYQGNRDLESALYHNVSLNYFSFNMFNLQNIFARFNYSKRIDAFKGNTSIEGINQVRSTINSNLEDETFSGSGSFQRTFGRIKVKTNASLSLSSTYNIVNELPQNSKSVTQSYTASVGSSFTNAPNLELGLRYSINDYNNGDTSTTYYTNRPFAKFDAAFLKNFLFLLDYDHYIYTDKEGTIDNRYGFLDASLSYHKSDSKWEYSLEATNLTNNSTLDQNSNNDFYFSTSNYVVQPRYVVLKVKYEL
ncbi:carboxypeptidase-like regulatory domain-containing protein [Allomuricauda sp. F6463D]|uniref:carboxypeptidase-like regulatory domain-containing protein n=1 Tax=Allomuricauda sp. F6463D TaxID=2926409 RepID=UPI001FF41B10|nr:carboxypeptidase-like regulatory domain-containing protein [Muricauda sp. F6463D]MCK0161760.1 outer membrane beta-barrel protein [Muricauda sp. F6463D]